MQNSVALSAAVLPDMAAKAAEEASENDIGKDRPFFNFKRSFADFMENDMDFYEDKMQRGK